MKKKASRIVSAVCALAMCAAMVPAAAFAEGTTTNGPVSENGVTIDKTATGLYKSDQADVTLTIGSSESKEKVAVMFLLDKSTSQGMRDEAAKMLDELAGKSNTDILYDVVIFSGTAKSTGWKDIQDGYTLDEIKANFVNGETTSGTNMDAGIEEATRQMNALPKDYADAATYLVTLSDGITYVWTAEDGKVKCVPVQGMNANETAVEEGPQNAVDTWAMMYENGKSLADVYAEGETDISAIMKQFKIAVQGKMQNTINLNHVQDYYGQTPLANPITTYVYNDTKTAEVAAECACGIDFAVYESAVGYEALVKKFDYSYAYAVPEAKSDGSDNTGNWDSYPWGKELMAYCQSLSTNKDESIDVSNADAEKIFSSIKDQILYTIQSGTVNDVIGNHFDLADINSFQLTVGGKKLVGKVDEDNNTVTFDDGKYVVTYYPATETSNEYFTWQINAPVAKDVPLCLTYTLQLVNKETKPGIYTPPTNESATLDYTTTDGEDGSMKFPEPTVSYEVKALTPDGPTYDELNTLLDAEVQCTTNANHATDHTDLLENSYDVSVDATKADGLGNGATATVTVNSDLYVQHYNENMNTGLTHTLASGTDSTWTVQLVYVANEGWALAKGQANKAVFYVSCPDTSTTTTTGTPTPDEHPDIAEGIANGTWGAAPTATPAAASTIPQTSDNLPLGALIVVAIVAAGAVCGLIVLRKRSKQ